MTDKFMAQLAEIHASGRCRGGINDPWGMRSHTPECRALVDADAAARRHGSWSTPAPRHPSGRRAASYGYAGSGRTDRPAGRERSRPARLSITAGIHEEIER